MSDPFIKIEELSYLYEDSAQDAPPALRGLSLEINDGEFVAILGHNGSGKSTLAKLLSMVLVSTSGKILIDGKDITSEELTDDDVMSIRKNVGMVFQNPDNQIVATIVEEDVAFGPENIGIPSEEIRTRVDDALAAVGMSDFAHFEPHRLSGGQKQRVAIAGIIAMMPDCMIFDESTAMLDPIGRAEVLETMEKMVRDRGITVLNITHHMTEAARADRIIVMDNGQIIADDVPSKIFADAELIKKAGLELTQSAELMHKLSTAGLEITDIPITVSDAVEKICEVIGN
jgi:energy-coupling factor transport system ATP-binding protein